MISSYLFSQLSLSRTPFSQMPGILSLPSSFSLVFCIFVIFFYFLEGKVQTPLVSLPVNSQVSPFSALPVNHHLLAFAFPKCVHFSCSLLSSFPFSLSLPLYSFSLSNSICYADKVIKPTHGNLPQRELFFCTPASLLLYT